MAETETRWATKVARNGKIGWQQNLCIGVTIKLEGSFIINKSVVSIA